MYSGSFTIWLWYILASFVLIACWWFLIKRLPFREIKIMSLVSIAVFLFFPWAVAEGSGYAPAWLMVGMEMFSQGPEGFGRAGVPLVIAFITALIASMIVSYAVNRLRA